MISRSAWFDEDVQALYDVAEDFFVKEVTPHLDRHDAQKHVDRELWRKAGEVGLLCCSIPEQYGGGGGSFLHDAAVFQAQAASGAINWGLSVHSGYVAHYLLAYGTEEQKHRWLPALSSGDMVGAIAMTEPGAGSDLKAMTTRALPVEGGYRVNGMKTFITNGATCDLVVLAVKTDPGAGARGMSLLVLETDALAGFVRGRTLEKMGLHGQDTAELFFNDVFVPTSGLLGDEGAGFAMLMNQLVQERLVIGLQAVAAMESALAQTIAYTKARVVFDAPLFDKQNTRFELAEVATLTRAGRVFIDDCIIKHLDGKLDGATAAMCKWWLTDVQFQVMDRCLQLFGGYGYMREYPISRMFTDARVQRIYGGANEVMKEVIARSI